MTTLTQERCVACRKDSPRVTDEEITELGSGVIPNGGVSFQVTLQRKGLTLWILHTSHVDIAGAITWFAMVSLQMANKNFFAMRAANKVAKIPAVTLILPHEEMKSYARMKNAVVCAVLNALLACLATPSALGLKKSRSSPSLKNNACHA